MTRQMISVDEAWEIIESHASTPGTETVPLREAVGRTLAEPLVAKVTQPPLTVSAMDGYAVAFSDVQTGDVSLKVIGESPAGRPFNGVVNSGEAVRIFTGGALPAGTDHVVIQENTERVGELVFISEPETGPRHVRPAGLDFKVSDLLLPGGSGIELRPSAIAVAAAANYAELRVYRRPKVALIANGDELKPPGSELGPGEIISSNSYGLSALIEHWGGTPIDLGIIPDDPKAIGAAIERAKGADIIVPIGGASVGDHDHMRAVFAARGLDMEFQKVAVKPGKPTWFGRLGSSLVLGLPGNPASAWVCANLFLKALIWGSRPKKRDVARLLAPLPANGARETFLRGSYYSATVRPFPNQDSSLLTPLLSSNVLIRRLANAPAAGEGAAVEVFDLH